MPFKSEAQRKYMYANLPEIAKKWESETPQGKIGRASCRERV